jgi:hypothetical protein
MAITIYSRLPDATGDLLIYSKDDRYLPYYPSQLEFAGA